MTLDVANGSKMYTTMLPANVRTEVAQIRVSISVVAPADSVAAAVDKFFLPDETHTHTHIHIHRFSLRY